MRGRAGDQTGGEGEGEGEGRVVKGKWAAGIPPRNFTWIVKDQLAVSDRPLQTTTSGSLLSASVEF